MYFIDSRMGAAGDMILGAFIDLDLVDDDEIRGVLESAGNAMGPTKIQILKKTVGQTNGSALEITHERYSHVSGLEMQEYLEQGSLAIGLTSGRRLARNILDTILQAEVKVHNSTMDDIHLHETGSPDTLVDILGIAYFYEKFGLHDKVSGSPISVGQGKVEIEHGIVSVPAPATAEILNTMEFRQGPFDGEMTTPTGAAILNQILQGQTEAAPFIPKTIGCGFGTKSFNGNPGILKVLASNDFS